MAPPKLNLPNLGYIRALKNAPIDGPKLAETFDSVSRGVGNVANRLASNPSGVDNNPPQIAMLEAQHLGNGLVDIAITDNGNIQSAISYYVEYSVAPGFPNSRYIHLGTSRNATVYLPNGSYYFKAYSQYISGGQASPPKMIGPVQVVNSASGTLLASQGSGTGQPGQSGVGAGPVISR
jgi:hypothetical protein